MLTYALGQDTFGSPFSSKSSICLTFIFIVKDMNEVYWEFHVIILKTGQMGQTLLLPTLKVEFGLLIGIFAFDLDLF